MNAWTALMSLAATNTAPQAGSGETTMPGGPVGQSAAGPLLQLVLELGLVMLVVAMALCIYRLLKGPSLADRVLAADTLALEVTGLVIVLAIRLETTVFFDTALVVAIIGFVSTVAFAQYIGAGGSSDKERL